MSKGTNKELLGSNKTTTESKGGRPAIDEDLILRNMKLTDNNGVRLYTDRQLASMAGCTARSIRRYRKKFLDAGLLDEIDQDKKGIGAIEAELDAECIRAMGHSFHDWLHTRYKRESSAHTTFNFCSKVWDQVWEKPSLVEFTKRQSNVADICSVKFLEAFGDDKKRIRTRISTISFLYRFLDRESVRKKHMRMDTAKHPKPTRRVSEISSIEFGLQYQEIEDMVCRKLGEEARLMLRFKIASQMRTGDLEDNRELFGLRHDSQGQNYIKFLNDDQYVGHIYAKRSEEWDLIWLPQWVKDHLKAHLENVPLGEPVWSVSKADLRRVFGAASKKVTGRRLILHDCRKISVTWLYVLGVPAEVACMINVGWLDVGTAFKHYLDAKRLLRGSFKEEYGANIPEWFKEGLDDFKGQDAFLPSSSGGHF